MVELQVLDEEEVEKKVKYDLDYGSLPPHELNKEVRKLELEMKFQAENLNFEEAAKVRDLVRKIKQHLA